MKKNNPFAGKLSRFICWCFGIGLAGLASGICVGLIVFSVVYSQLPPIDALTDYKPKIPLRVYSAEGILIGEFGEEHRDFLRLHEIPPFVRNAV